MTVLLYIFGYIVLFTAFAYYLKYRKDREKEISGYSKAKQVANNIYDRKKHNDYMNNPKFSYMSCNRYNPNSSFHKERIARREKKYVLVEESRYNSLVKSENSSSDLNELILAQSGFCTPESYKYYGYCKD